MPVRLRITALFLALVMLILGLLCTAIYYFSYTAQHETVKTRLYNRAMTTARLLSQKEQVGQSVLRRIDSLTAISLTNRTVKAYGKNNELLYAYSDFPERDIPVPAKLLTETRQHGTRFFANLEQDFVAYLYNDHNEQMVIVSGAEDVDGEERLQTLLSILVVSFFLGNTLVFAAGYFFSEWLLQPIKKITDDVEVISAQNLARRINTGRSNDEWYHLAATLNKLLDRLQDSFESQRRFISNASHELLTPLTSISSQLEVSLQRDRSAVEYRDVMNSIHQDVRHMSKLTQTLLQFAMASGNPGGLEIDIIRIDEIILRVPSELARINPLYITSLHFDELPEDDEKLLVYGNEALLLTAIKNIAVNACKYAQDHTAEIALKILPDTVSVAITDRGPGIAAEELATIFQPFYRGDEQVSGTGFGLGLALTDRIIKIHKGRLEITSVVGEGSCFTIFLPSAKHLISSRMPQQKGRD